MSNQDFDPDETGPPRDNVVDYILAQQRAAMVNAMPQEDDDPEKAARAIELSNATGVHPALIQADQDNFEQQHKAALTASLLRNNKFLMDYAQNPVAAKVSGDDWGQMDAVSQATQKLHHGILGAPASVFGAAVKGFKDNLDLGSFGQDMPLDDNTNRFLWSLVSGVRGLVVETPSRLFTAGLEGFKAGATELQKQFGAEPNAAERRAEELTGMIEAEMMGLTGRAGMAHAPAAEIPPEIASAAKKGAEAYVAAKPYLDAGIEPPIGVHPLVDQMHTEQAKLDLKNLDEAFKESQASATRERAPELFADFIRQHTDSRIGIDAEAVRKLYGDKVPEADDNLLGWVPGIQDQLALAEAHGGDVEVPLADWLAKADPEVAKELHDFIRVRPGGMTLEETKEAGKPVEIGEDAVPAMMPIEGAGIKGADLDEMREANENKKLQAPTYEGALKDQVKQKYRGISAENADIRTYAEWKQVAEAEAPAHNTSAPNKPNAYAAARNYSRGSDKPTILIGSEGRRQVFMDGNKVYREPRNKELDALRMEAIRKSAGLEPIFAPGAAREGKAEPGIIPVNAAPYEGEPKEVVGGTQLSPYLNFPLKDALKQINPEFLTGIPAVLHEFYKDRLSKLAGDVTVHVAKDTDMFRVSHELFGTEGEYSPAFYNPSTDEIYVSDRYASGKAGHDAAAHILMHEGAHALSVIAMQEHPELADQVKYMMRAVKRSLFESGTEDILKESGHAYAFKNEKEFWAQAWSDIGFQHTLSMLPLPKDLAELIGMKSSTGKSIYDAFRRIIRMMMQKLFPGVDIPPTIVDGLFHLQSKFEQIEAKERGKKLGINEVEGAPPKGEVPQHLEEAVSDWMKGKLKAADVQKAFKAEGWNVDLRKGRYDVESTSPSGEIHYIEGAPPVKPEDAERDLFTKASAIGMTKDQYQRYMDLISKRAAEDLAHQVEQGKAIEREHQTKEWKDNFSRVREEIRADIRNRPDIAADRLLREGDLHGQKVRQPALNGDDLSPEQKAALPKDYYRSGGVSPDVVAGLFGYQSGDALVGALARLKQERELEGLTPAAHLSKITDAETERQMRKQYGNLEENILADAKDHVISQTQMDMLHEETLALGQQSGASLPMSKDDFKRGAKELFDGTPLGSHSTDKYLAAAGRAGAKAEQALLEGKPGDAFKAKQQQYISLLLANEAKKLEKVRGQFEKFAKTNSKREFTNRPAEYTNWIHDILMRTGNVVRRSVQDLQDAISREDHDTLEKFVLAKNTDATIWGDDPDNPPAGDTMPVASFLFNKDYRTTLDEMKPEEFRAVFDSLKTLDWNGKDDGKILSRGEKVDKAALTKALAERLQASMGAEKHYPPGDNSRSLTSTIGVAMLNVETVMNRADLGNARGMFNQVIVRPIVEGINSLAAMEKKYAAKYRALGDFGDVTKKLDNSILKDPLYNNRPADLTRGNLLAIIQNLGNPTQMDKFFRGWRISKEQQPAFMNWVFKNSTKEDWDRAQKLGDLFEEIFKESADMYHNISGVAPARITLRPIETPFGTYPGFYHPLIYDPIRRGPNKMDKVDMMEGSGYFAPATAAGYTKQRTGYAAPIQLNFDAIPFKIKTMLNDIAMHPAITNTAKIFRDPEFKQAMVKYYGKEYEAMLDPWLRSAAGQRAYSTPLQAAAGQVGDFIRENLVTTLIGLNPGTVLKHAPTAAIMSMKEVGVTNFWREFHHMLLRDDDYHFAMTNSEELQRRFRNWQETLTGSQQELFKRYSMDTKFFTVRDMMQRIGAAPVALSDMLSAVPTWLAQYKATRGDGLEHGDAVFEANRAVRRAHGSSALTNRPEIMRTGPMGQYLVPFYNFFSTVLQRQYEQAWKAKLSIQGRDLERAVPQETLEAPNVVDLRKDEYHEQFPGHEYKAGLSNLPHLMGGLFAYIIAPAIIEQMVQPVYTKKDSYLTMAAKTIGFGLASSWPVVRDGVNAALEGRDPSLGLYSTALKSVEDFYRDLQKGTVSMNPQHAAKTIMHFNTLVGTLFGITNNEIGKIGQFTYNWAQGREKPEGLTDIWAGIRHGTMKDLRQ